MKRSLPLWVALAGLPCASSYGETITSTTFDGTTPLGHVNVTNTSTDRSDDLVGVSVSGTTNFTAPLSGSITVATPDVESTDSSYASNSMTGVLIDSTSSDTFSINGLTTNIDIKGADYGYYVKNDSWGVVGKHKGSVSVSNSSINITTESDTTYSLASGIVLDAHLESFDASSSITIGGSGRAYTGKGIQVNTLGSYEGSITIKSKFAEGIQVFDGQAGATLGGSVTINALYDANAISYAGQAESISTAISMTRELGTTGGSTMRGIYLENHEDYSQMSEVKEISSNITITSTGAVRGIEIDDYSKFGTISGDITINAGGSEAFGIISNGTGGEISSHVRVSNTGTSKYQVSNTAGVLANLGYAFTHGGEVYDSASPAISGKIEATGISTAVGVHFTYKTDEQLGFDDPDAPVPDYLNKSGLITGSISAHTSESTYLFDAAGNVITDRSSKHYKSTVGIRVADSGTWLGSLVPPTEGNDAVLNFGHGVTVSALVGEGAEQTLGDAIQFDSPNLTLHAGKDDVVTLTGDITSLATKATYEGGVSGLESPNDHPLVDISALPKPKPPVEWSSDSVATQQASSTRAAAASVDSIGAQEDALIFSQGKYHVKSDYWFVSEVAVGSYAIESTSQITLTGSTKFADTNMLSFHVNSTSDYSSITVSATEMLTINELGTVNVTLGAELMAAETFRLTLIDGDMFDTAGNTLTVNLFDLITEGTGGLIDDLASIYVEYDGVRYDYEDGPVTFTYTGEATDLVIGREIIPEPSTATLSLLALAGLLSRRRRGQRQMERA